MIKKKGIFWPLKHCFVDRCARQRLNQAICLSMIFLNGLVGNSWENPLVSSFNGGNIWYVIWDFTGFYGIYLLVIQHGWLENGVFLKMGVPNSWMVYEGKSENPTKMDADWGYPLHFRKPPFWLKAKVCQR